MFEIEIPQNLWDAAGGIISRDKAIENIASLLKTLDESKAKMLAKTFPAPTLQDREILLAAYEAAFKK